MRKLDDKIISAIQKLRSKGYSYKEISHKLELSPATTFKYSKSIKLSFNAKKLLNEKMQNIWKNFTVKFSKPNAITNNAFDEYKARLLGHLLFDGSVRSADSKKYEFRYLNASIGSINNFIQCVAKTYGLTNGKISSRGGVNVTNYCVSFCSKKAFENLVSFSRSFSTSDGIGVPEIIFKSPEKIKISFLKAFWGDEGSIANSGNLSGSSKSSKMIKDLLEVHNSLGINCTIYKDRITNISTLRVRNSSMVDFYKKINFDYSIVTRGHNIGKFKRNVLKAYLKKKDAGGRI